MVGICDDGHENVWEIMFRVATILHVLKQLQCASCSTSAPSLTQGYFGRRQSWHRVLHNAPVSRPVFLFASFWYSNSHLLISQHERKFW